MEQKNITTGWDSDCGMYTCTCGPHSSWWQAIVRTPEWEAWYKEVGRRMSEQADRTIGKPLEGVWDVDESQECGWMSVEHAKDFLAFVKTLK